MATTRPARMYNFAGTQGIGDFDAWLLGGARIGAIFLSLAGLLRASPCSTSTRPKVPSPTIHPFCHPTTKHMQMLGGFIFARPYQPT